MSHIFLFSLLLICLTPFSLLAEADDALKRDIKITKGKGTIYQLLTHITESSGYMFIYDSHIIDNDKKANIPTGTYTIGEAIRQIVNDISIGIRVIERHIILERKEPTYAITLTADPIISADTVAEIDSFFTVEGIIKDRQTEEIIPYSTVGILGTSIGTVSNQTGMFRIRLPIELRDSALFFSHLGYEGQKIKAEALANKYNQILMEQNTVKLQEVIVENINPKELVRDVMLNKARNYAQKSVLHTSFYREGIEHKKRIVNLTESVLQIYKAPYSSGNDQAKLLKMRQITNEAEKDTLFTKLKSGIYATLMLDLIKHPIDFLDFNNDNPYVYLLHDVEMINGQYVYVIRFEQHKFVRGALYRGYLYIDMDDNALVEARFEIHPDYVSEATNSYIFKRNRGVSFSMQKVEYLVSYKKWKGVYYINHIRGDLHFHIKKAKHWFNNAPLHIWFETVTCKTETGKVNSFTRNEALPTRSIFAETLFTYDEAFWEDFNIIQPEETLTESIKKITTKIEETVF